jgi:hypothetical protein
MYQGELSMFEDPLHRPSRATSPVAVPANESWTEERLLMASRHQHTLASAEEGEAWTTAYFSWASPVYSVVHRPVFISRSKRRSTPLILGDMALGGPYFSQFLLLVTYITGIRLTYGMDAKEREMLGERYTNIALGMLGTEVIKPGSIATIRECICS